MPEVTPDFTFTNNTTADADQVQDVIAEIAAAVNDLDLGNLAAAQIVRGRVAASGTIAGGSGFSVNKTGTGVYVVTYSTAFAATPVLLPSSVSGGDAGVRWVLTAEAATGFTIQMDAGGSDQPFRFVAVAV